MKTPPIAPLLLCLLTGCAADPTPGTDAAAATDLALAADSAVAPSDAARNAPDLAMAGDLAAPPPDLARADLAAYVCYGPGSSFPAFPRQCAVDADCYVAVHQIDCCGSHAAGGIRAGSSAAFEAAEATFRVVCPALCDCVARPTVCDDGRSAPEPAITVTCDKGTCTTHGQ